MGHRGSGSNRYSGELAARATGNIVSRGVWQPVLANMLQYSCLENPLSDREAWQDTVYRVAKSRTGQKRPCVHKHKTFFFFFGLGSSAPVRVEHEGGAAAWLAGTLVALSVQGHKLPPQQELWPHQCLFPSLL